MERVGVMPILRQQMFLIQERSVAVTPSSAICDKNKAQLELQAEHNMSKTLRFME